MGQRERAGDLGGHCLAGRVRDVVDREDDDVVADADGAVGAPVAVELHAHHLAVLMLCVWT
jgi:hypothetical protein